MPCPDCLGNIIDFIMRENFNDLQAFVTVAREQSFTRAAAQLGVSPSALSHTMRALEERLKLRLLTRTTRSVTLTEAGERLFNALAPKFEGITAEVAALAEMRDVPGGTVRISATDHSINTVLWPRLEPLLHEYPDIRIELISDYRLVDIVAERYDAGVRSGDQVGANMIAVRIGPDIRMVVVGSPEYLRRNPAPKLPQELAAHQCINLRLPTLSALMVWEFERNGEAVKIRVDGQWVFSGSYPMLEAALAGYGLAYLPEDMVAAHVKAGALQSVLDDWAPVFPGYHLYYPSRRHASSAFAVVLNALRQRV